MPAIDILQDDIPANVAQMLAEHAFSGLQTVSVADLSDPAHVINTDPNTPPIVLLNGDNAGQVAVRNVDDAEWVVQAPAPVREILTTPVDIDTLRREGQFKGDATGPALNAPSSSWAWHLDVERYQEAGDNSRVIQTFRILPTDNSGLQIWMRESIDNAATWGDWKQTFPTSAAIILSPKHPRHASHFGIRETDYNEIFDPMVDNTAAVQAAVDHTTDTGGEVIYPAGKIGIAGSIELHDFCRINGSQRGFGTIFKQMDTAFGGYVFDTPEAGAAHMHLSNFTLDGGWEQDWTFDDTLATGGGIRIRSAGNGVANAAVDRRTDRTRLTDIYGVLENLYVVKSKGIGVDVSGRGEMLLQGLWIDRAARHCMNVASPDNWIKNCSMWASMDTALIVSAGNIDMEGLKLWFAGLRSDYFVEGAGLKLDGSGNKNIIGRGIRTQDTMGPGVIVDGDSPRLEGNIDNPAGGRLIPQLIGYQGAYEGNRCAVRMVSAARSELNFSVGNNDLGAAPEDLPHLIDFTSAGAEYNEVNFHTHEAVLHADPVTTNGGYNNNAPYNRVWKDMELVEGFVDPLLLEDTEASINQPGGPTEIILTDGRKANRNEAGDTWVIHGGDALTVVHDQAGYLDVGNKRVVYGRHASGGVGQEIITFPEEFDNGDIVIQLTYSNPDHAGEIVSRARQNFTFRRAGTMADGDFVDYVVYGDVPTA